MKKAIIALVALALALGMAGCAGETGPDLVIQSYMSDEAPKAAFAKLVAEFEKQTGLDVEVNTTAHEQFKTQIVSYLTSEDAPDVLTWFAGFRMQQYAMKGLLEPIGDVFPGGAFEKEFPVAFKGAASYDGQVYFMPQSWYWWAVYYNKEVFAANGLTPPENWEQFLKVCETLKAAGIAPIAVGAKDTWTVGGWFDYLDVAVNGGDFHRELTLGKVPYTDARVVKTFGYLAELASKGYFIDGASALSWQESVTPLANGTAGMYLMGQFIMDSVPKEAASKIDFFRFPLIERADYGVDTPTDGFVMPKKAKHKENAKKFIAFLASAEAQAMFCNELGRLAANVTVKAPNEAAERGLAMVKGAATAMQFYDRDAPEEMAAKGMDAMVRIMQTPNDLMAILTGLDKERERIYAELQ
jgi:multiple sugar transport system substrate-binding protein